MQSGAGIQRGTIRKEGERYLEGQTERYGKREEGDMEKVRQGEAGSTQAQALDGRKGGNQRDSWDEPVHGGAGAPNNHRVFRLLKYNTIQEENRSQSPAGAEGRGDTVQSSPGAGQRAERDRRTRAIVAG